MTEEQLQPFGFKFGKNGAHSARTIMLDELVRLFEHNDSDTTKERYLSDIIDYNLLDKGTDKSRQLTSRHLIDLYSLDNQVPLFRIFRKLWSIDPAAQALLALQLALARDPILRQSAPVVLATIVGDQLARETMEAVFRDADPDRYSPASLKSIAQNVNGSWTRAGYLQGRNKKIRAVPDISPVNVVYALFQASLTGATGQRLLTAQSTRLLQLSEERLLDMAASASHRGIIDFRHSGGVIDIRFPDFLTAEEQEWLHE